MALRCSTAPLAEKVSLTSEKAKPSLDYAFHVKYILDVVDLSCVSSRFFTCTPVFLSLSTFRLGFSLSDPYSIYKRTRVCVSFFTCRNTKTLHCVIFYLGPLFEHAISVMGNPPTWSQQLHFYYRGSCY